MASASQQKWDAIYTEQAHRPAPTAAAVLRRNRHLLPTQGRALDYACGRGGNAMLLAEQGLLVQALDISSVVIERLQQYSDAQGLSVQAQTCDLSASVITPGSVDVLVCSYYLSRAQLPELMHALAPGGLLFYETFNASLPAGRGPSNPDFLLQQAELLQCFSPLQVLYYEELWQLEDTDGNAGISRIVARKSSY